MRFPANITLLSTMKTGVAKSQCSFVSFVLTLPSFDGFQGEVADVYEVAGDGCGCGHYRADQMGAAVAALAALEVAVAGAGAAFVGGQDVGVHANAHAAAGVAPLETGVGENLVEAFLFGLGLDAARARND